MHTNMKKKRKTTWLSVCAIVANIVLITFVILSVSTAINTADDNSTTQNEANIRTLTEASADKVALEIDHRFTEAQQLSDYINAYNNVGMTQAEIETYFTEYFASDTDSGESWILVDNITSTAPSSTSRFFAGHVPSDSSERVREYYNKDYGELAIIFAAAGAANLADEPQFASEVSDPKTAELGFPITSTVRIREENDEYTYKTLLYFVKTEALLAIISSNSTAVTLYYEGYSGTIIDSNGEYIVSSDEFMVETNICDYLAFCNDSFTESDSDHLLQVLRSTDAEASKTPLYYDNTEHVECIFTLSPISGTDWFIISIAPLDSFKITYDFNSYFLKFALFFIALFVLDAIFAILLIQRLRLHMHLEREANASKSSFLSRMSHEIRTPLNAVIGYMTIAKNDPSNHEKIQDCINKTDISAKHLLSVINDILDVSAIESGKITIVNDSFNFKSLINSITVMFYTLANNKRVSFDVIFESLVDESVIGDQMRVNQILINLLNNAVKFTPPGGSVTLRIKQEDAEDNKCAMSFVITDSGIGMSEMQLKKIWQPFEQADNTISRQFGGSGLGLTITMTLTEMMGGTVDVKSEVGKGSTFTVKLKFGKTSQLYANINYDFSSINALVVDDDLAAAEYAKNLLNHYNIRCVTAFSGDEALQTIARAVGSEDPFNFCLLDLKMEGMDGIETARHIIKKYGNGIPIIILSAYDFSEYVEEAKALGIKKFLSKPLFKSALFDMLVSMNSEKNIGTSDPRKDSESDDYDFGGAKLLLAEDNQTNMEIAIDLLSFANLTVDKAWNGEEAVELFNAAPSGYYKAILMDVQMPLLDGYSATRRIRASNHPDARTIPIIAMTANAFEQDIRDSLNAGMNDHISKPIDEVRLFKVLHDCGVH